jgi:hypothetical protein
MNLWLLLCRRENGIDENISAVAIGLLTSRSFTAFMKYRFIYISVDFIPAYISVSHI